MAALVMPEAAAMAAATADRPVRREERRHSVRSWDLLKQHGVMLCTDNEMPATIQGSLAPRR